MSPALRVAIVGGAGQIARLLHGVLQSRGHVPVALVRRSEQAEELAAAGVETRMLDIEAATDADFATAFEGCDAVVFAAGGGPDGNLERKRTVDLEGALKSLAGAASAGVGRYVQISAIGVDDPIGEDTSEVWRAYVEAKRDSDAAVRGSDLAWTILRPGRLVDDPATARVALGSDVASGEVTRADVALTVAAVLDEPATAGAQWNLVGGDQPVEEAVRAALGRAEGST